MVDKIRDTKAQDNKRGMISTQALRQLENLLSQAKIVKWRKPKILVLSFLSVLVILAIGAGSWFLIHKSVSPVPKNIQAAVKFTIYYPDQKKLPPGYTLDTKSFTGGQGAVIYDINYGNNKLFFSVQQKPKDIAIQGFNSKYLTLHTNVQLKIGMATVGAINNGSQLHSLVSIPTDTNAWILITGPPNINQDQLKQVLQAIKY